SVDADGTVRVWDLASGQLVPAFHDALAVSLAANPGGSVLGGQLSVTPSDGVASFTGLTLDKAASGYRLRVSGPSLTARATTASIDVARTLGWEQTRNRSCSKTRSLLVLTARPHPVETSAR